MPSYKYNGNTYDIPADKVADFEAKYQDATMAYKDGDTIYDIPVNKREKFLSKYPNAIQWDDQTQKDTLETNLADFSAQYGDFMSEYESFEKHLKAPEMEPEYLPNYEAHMAQADEYNLRRSEREKMLKEYFSNPLVIKEREGRAGDARLMAESFAAAAGRMEQDNPELAKKAAKFSMSMIPGRGPLVLDDQTRQYREDHANYETARRFAEEAQEIYAAPSKYDDSVGVVNFLKGAKNVANSADFWTMGMSGIADNFNALDALAKVQEKLGSIKNLTEENINRVLSPSEAALVTAWVANVDAQARRAEDLSRGYQAGQGATESLGFMAQFLLTGGVGKAVSEAATKGMTKWLAGQLGKMAPGAVKNVTKGAAKGVLGTVKSLTKAAVQTPLMPSTYENISEVMLEIDNSGKLIEADKAFWTGLADSMIETWSESAGGMVEEILGVPLKLGKSAWNKALGETSFGKWGQSLTRTPAYNLMKRAGWNGYIGELGEEWLGNSVRTLTGLDPDALKDFATVDQQIITMTSFAPMAVFGLGASAAQYKAAKNRAANAAEALSGVLQQAGYSQGQISFVLDDMNASTPRQLSETLTPVVNQIAKDTGFGSEAFKAVMNYADAMAKYRTLDGFYQREQESKMLDARGDIESKTKQLFYQIHDTGKPSVTGDGNVYIEEVRVVENSDGSRFFVVGQSEDGTLAAVDEQGGKRFITEDEITRQFENGSITSDQTMMLRDFLSAEVVRNQQAAEQARMTEDARNAVAQIRQAAQPGTEVNLGTAEAPVVGIVTQVIGDGVVVQTEAGVSQLSWEEAGRVFGIDATPRTDEEIEAGEVAQIEATRAERMTRLAQTADEAAGAEIEALDALSEESVAEPLPLKADGSVDQTSLWNQNPERWAEWNDEQRQDGGVNSLGYINGAIAREEAAVAELTAAYNAEPDFDTRASMESQVKAVNERLNRLVALQQKYAPLMQAEAPMAEEASEKEAQPASGPTEAAPAESIQETDPVRQTLIDLYNDEELSESEIEDYINANAKKAQSDLDKHLAKAPKMGTDMAKYKADRAKHQEKTVELEKQRDFWKEVQSYIEVPEVSEMDMEPQDALEFTANELTRKNGIKLQRDSFARHTGYGAEAGNFLTILRSKANGGLTLEEAGERLMEMDRENNTGFFDQNDPNAGLNAILAVIAGARTSGDISGYIRANREQVAKEQVAAARNAMMEDIKQSGTGNEVQPSYVLSDEVDENGRQFVLSPNGTISFGEITNETGLTPAPILLSEGLITNPATNDGYGLVHIEARHGDQIRNAGYDSIIDFVAEVASNYEVIREGKNRDGYQTYMLQLTDKHNNTLMVELSGDGTYWNINTAGIFKTSYGANRKEVYNRHTTDKQFVETAEASQVAEQSDTQTTSSMNAPTTSSDSKDSDSVESTMESDEKVEDVGDIPDEIWYLSDEDAVRRATEMVTTEQDRVRLEEEKRAVLRERIKEWEQKLGVQVDVMESVDDVTNAQAKQQILNGREVFGWFDVTSGKVAFYLPDYVLLPTANGLSEIDKTYIHEVVSHKGLRGLLGEEKFGELCDRVWETMSQDDQQKYLSYPGVNGNKRIAADEYIASFAETINYESNLSAWAKIVSFVKDILNSIGIQIGLSENDLASLLHASYNKLVSENSAGKMVEKISLDEYLGRLGLSSPISDYMDDKLRNPHGLTESQRNQLEKEAAEAATDYQNRRRAAIEEYNRLVSEGSIIPPTQIDSLLAVANGHPDNQSTQAARRSLEKRGYDWQTGQKLTDDKVEKKISEADSASEEMDSSQKIEDFGEKIGGARKDVARAKIRNSVNLTGKDLKELKDPDKILSRKQIIKYFNEGQMTLEDAQTMLAANMAVRSADTSYKELALTKYRDMAVAWEKGEEFGFNLNESDIDMLYNRYDQKMKDKIPDLRERVAKSIRVLLFKAYEDYRNTYEALQYPAEYRDLKSLVIQYGTADSKYWVLSSANARRGWPKATMLEAVAYVKNNYPVIDNESKADQDTSKSGGEKKETYGHLHVVKSRYGGYRIKSRVIPGEVYISQKEFYSKKTAEAYLKENAERLVERERTLEEALMGSNIGMVERKGEDYRQGKDVTPQDFLDTFGFRGVEFGNWVPQAERQMYLNKTYDAIMDFCKVIGISPKAFTLGGRLAIGFGSRGKSRAMAHYESGLEVINLTRMKGAGSLAHEWFHALDNLLAKQKTGNSSDMITDVKDAVREEVITAFTDFVKKMDSLPYTRRSHRAGEYWGEVWERAARLFENYVYNELGGKGMVSPLLVRKDSLYEETAEDFGSGWWPYPSERENAEIKPYFDALFNALQEQVQEDGNVVLYRAKPEVDENVAGLETLVERIYRTTGAFSFSGSNAIESSDDVAYIFRQLEDSAVENSFLVFVKDGVPTILHTGMGNVSSTFIDNSVVLPAYKDFGADKVYMVHNHPSGTLKASQNDLNMLLDISNQLPGVSVEGIIINTTSGEYGVFDLESARTNTRNMPESAEETELTVLSFDRNVFSPDYKVNLNERKISNAEDVASFLSAHRLGEGSKVGALLLNIGNVINGNLVTNENEVSMDNADLLARQIAEAANRTGSTTIILFGDFDYSTKAIRQLEKQIVKASGKTVSMLDVVRLAGKHTQSMMEDTLPYRSTLNDGVRFRASNNNQAIFVSNAAKAVEGIKQEKATPEQWLKMIEKAGGLKAGEDKWMGLSDWLKASDKKTLTKAEVLDFINENMIIIEEQHYGESNLSSLQEEFNEIYDGIIDNVGNEEDEDLQLWEVVMNPMERAWEELRDRYYGGDDFDMAFSYDSHGNIEVNDPDAAAHFLGIKPINDTRLDYTTEGLTDRHEIALTVPTIEPWDERDDVHFGDAGDGRAIAWIRFGETKKLLGTTEVDGKKKFNWARVLIIDEIQSNRHQEGREKGYRVTNIDKWLKDNNIEVVETGEFFEFIMNGETDRRFSKGLMNYDIEKAKRLYVSGYNKSDIPDAPFDKNWHELAMKRMLRYAAENGYDVIAWTTGDQQNQRYGLSKVIDEIYVASDFASTKNEESSFRMILKNGNDNHVGVNKKTGIVTFYNENPQAIGKPLSALLGKELADKILAARDYQTFSGVDFELSEGMKGFYDKILPAFMNKYGKKWGVKVEDIKLNGLENGITMHSVPVTEEMKASVMEGQVMFRMRGENESAEEFHRKAIANYLQTFNEVAPIKIGSLESKAALAKSLDVPEEKITDEVFEAILAGYEQGGYGGYIDALERIVIFAREEANTTELLEQTLFHESIHKIDFMDIEDGEEFGEWLWENADNIEDLSIFRDMIEASPLYEDDGFAEEMLANSISWYMMIGEVDNLLAQIPEEFRETLNTILNEIGYETEDQSRLRQDPKSVYARAKRLFRQTVQDAQRKRNDQEGIQENSLRFRATEITPEVRAEMDAISATAIVNGNYMKAPNGKDTNLTPEQWAMVRTKGFREWFKDSKVVDENGEPRVVFHGTEEDFTAFDEEMIGENTDTGFYGRGFYFATTREEAQGYGENVMDVFLSLKNPLDLNRVYAESNKWDGATADGAVRWWYGLASIFPEDAISETVYANIDGDEWTIADLKNRIDELAVTSETPFADATAEFGIDEGFFDMMGEEDVNLPEELTDALKANGYDGVINAGAENNEMVALYPSQIKSATDNTGEFSEEEGDIRFKVVTDPAKIEELENGPTIKVYRAMQLIDGKLYPPMSAKVDGQLREPIELGQWEEAEERPDLADDKGYFKLDKGNKKSLKARYNPYFHTSYTPLNDQFSEAQDRPNLVIVEVEIPVSELTSGYKADKAKDSVGEKEWKAGVIQGKLSGTRKVILSRWDKPVRIVPDSEVADVIVKMFEGKDIVMPSNVVTPSLRAELENRGVPFVETDNQGKKLTNIAEMTTPIWSSKGTFANLAEAEEWARKNLQGKSRVNRYTGERISIGSNSISKMLSPKAQKQSSSISAHLAALKSVLDFIKTGIPAEVHADQEGRDFNVLRLYNAIEIDNKLYRVKSTVKKVRQGDKFYTYEVQEMELIEERWSSQKGEADNPRNPDNPINSITGAKLLKGVKKSNSNENILPESENVSFRVNENPTEAQKEAGNYKMGHLNLDGYRITIENPKGSVRRGTDSKGNAWENTLNNDYGYIRGTEGVDGDHIDVYLSDNPSEGNVFVIDQVNPETREFDEHKVMYGFNSAEEAREAYLANFSEGWNGLGTITEVSKDEFKKWIQSSHRKTKPFSEYKSVNAIGSQSEGMEDEDLRPATGTPTDKVVANGLSLSPAQTADLAGNIFAALPESARAEVTASLNGDILGLQDAIMQIPARLATKEDWSDEDRQMADIVASEVTKIAGEMTRPFSAPEALWLLYDTLNKPTDLISEAQRVLVQRNLGFDAETQEVIDEAKDGVRFRTVGDASDNARASMYNKGAVNVWSRLKESFVDMNDSVEKLVKAMEKASGKVAQGFENILLALNQQSSKGLAAMERYEKKYLGPMLDEVKRIIKDSKKTYEDVVRYVILKHGLERNETFAKRDAREFYSGMFDKVAARMKTQSHAQRVVSLSDAKRTLADIESKIASATGKKLERLKEERELAMQEVTVAELVLRGDEKQNEADLKARMDAIDAGTDAKYLELRDTDYSGITSMFYDQLDVNRADYETEEEYQAALMLAKNDRYKTLADVEAAAQQEVDAFESGIDTTALWNKINAATKEILRQQYQSNMISKDQYESLRDMFQYYVPLRGFADNTAEDMYTYYRRPNSTGYTKPILGAEGRKTEAESPFGWIAAMAGSAIASNVKNEAKLALFYFVSNRPDNGIATISKTWFEFSHTDPDTGKKVYKPVYPPFTEDLSSDAAKAAYEQWQKDMEAKRAAGQAYESGQRLNLGNSVVNISDVNKPEHIVTVKVGGKDYTILINGNPRAAQAINGDLNIEATGSADYSKVLGPWLRWLSNVNTSYNPEFWFMNMQRDMLFTLMNVSASQTPEYRKKFANNYMKAFKVISLVAKNEKGALGSSYIENMYKDFVEYGGVTGYTQIKDSETWEKEIERMMNSANMEDKTMAKVLSGTKDVLHTFHRFGESLEQVSRFAAFMTSREMGKSMAESISDAKEITVNFNRKGSGKMISWEETKHLTGKSGQPLNGFQRMLAWGVSSMAPLGRRFIMFFNAAIQGLNAMYRLYKNNPSKMAGWSIGYAAVGIMQALLHGLLDDDDDYLDIPQYERRTALLLGANGVYFKWALPQEARAFYALGELAVETIMGRNPHQNIITEALKIASDVAPINPAEGVMALVPSQIKPFVELWVNKDWKGDPIYNDQKWLSKEERRRTAKHSSAFKGTGKLYIDISKGLNKISGGDDFDAGLINIQPEKMEHIVQSAFGGTIRTIDKFFNSVIAAVDPDEPVTVRQLPFINRFLTINDERFKNVHVNDVYDWYAGEAEHALTLQKKYKKVMDSKAYGKLIQSDEYRWAQIYSRYKKPIKNLQEQIKVADGTVERMELMKRQDELKRQMIKEISQLP